MAESIVTVTTAALASGDNTVFNAGVAAHVYLWKLRFVNRSGAARTIKVGAGTSGDGDLADYGTIPIDGMGVTGEEIAVVTQGTEALVVNASGTAVTINGFALDWVAG